MRKTIPNKYISEILRILPYKTNLFLSEFKNTCFKSPITVFSVENLSTELWFDIFKKEVLESINKKKFLPVCRFCDGEFIFLNKGLDLIDQRIKLRDKLKIIVKNILTRLNLIQFSAFTSNKYTSGQYSYKEIVSLNSKYKRCIKFILENGTLATSTLTAKNPFSDRFFKLFSDFILSNNIKITPINNVPYIFVYALFAGKSRFEIFNKKKVLIINSFNTEQKKTITNKLKSFGAADVFFSNISSNRSAFDKLDIELNSKVDFILIGAGLGKLFHFEYLSKFNVPCIDIGYIFQTWLDPTCSSHRVFCSSNDIYDSEFDK